MTNRPRIHFIQTNLLALTVPEGQQFIEVQDDEIKALRFRLSALGRMTFFLDVKVRGKHVKRTLGTYNPGPDGKTVADFRKQARAELKKIDDDAAAWLEGGHDVESGEITIEAAFKAALSASKRGQMSRNGWAEAVDRFTAWMKTNHPYVTTWARLRRSHVKEYMDAQTPTEQSVKRGLVKLSPTRMRLLMQPITQTARFMWHEHEIPNVAEQLGLSAKLAKTPAPVYVADVLGFLEHLRKAEEPQLEAGAALAGLAGLQLLEVLRLTWSRVDRDRGLVEISGEVKNEYRNRVIPIPARCLEALERAYNARPASVVQEMSGGHVVVSPRGRPFIDGSWMNYSKLVKDQIRAWNSKLSWAPKDLRNCILTLAAVKGFSSDVLEQYVGHAPRSVTARNYIPRLTSASFGEAGALEAQMKIFRTLVVDYIDAEVKAAGKKRKGAAVVKIAKGGKM